MKLSPLDRYQECLEGEDVIADEAQLRAIKALDEIWSALQKPNGNGLIGRLRKRTVQPVRGLYLWGGVGRGKTWLMDLFYTQLPGKDKQRIHFHRFMQRVHNDLRTLGNIQNPLTVIADDWARSGRVLCLDEFFVSDIADAMLLAGLLEVLFKNGVTLITTSNIAPGNLYKGGLQRAKFLPAIELIKQHTTVMNLEGDTDFRLRILQRSNIFYHPLNQASNNDLASCFDRMAADCELNLELDINGRIFRAKKRGDGIIWFEFEELCEKPRGSIDFIEIAKAFNTVAISGIPQLGRNDSDAARRFITLVDEFYDRNVKMLITAAVPIAELYTGTQLAFEFLRTISRLTEMQSDEYLAKPHLP